MTDDDSRSIVLFQPQPDHIYNFDALQLLELMPSESVHCIVTSPPYFGLRDYGVVAHKLGRHFIGCDVNPEYVELATMRVAGRLDEYLARQRGEAYSAYMFDFMAEPVIEAVS
jgi:DNA modification methylase